MLPNLTALRNTIITGATLIERPGEGSKKKEELKEIVYQILPEGFFDIDKKIFDFLLDKAIDLIVAWLNRTIWKAK
jgi:hypothetical protein